jgi:hypothetical protein
MSQLAADTFIELREYLFDLLGFLDRLEVCTCQRAA